MLALAAPRERGHDMVARGQMLNRIADSGDDARSLVTVNGWIGHREIAVAGMQISVTNAGGRDLNQHLVRARTIKLEALELKDP